MKLKNGGMNNREIWETKRSIPPPEMKWTEGEEWGKKPSKQLSWREHQRREEWVGRSLIEGRGGEGLWGVREERKVRRGQQWWGGRRETRRCWKGADVLVLTRAVWILRSGNRQEGYQKEEYERETRHVARVPNWNKGRRTSVWWSFRGWNEKTMHTDDEKGGRTKELVSKKPTFWCSTDLERGDLWVIRNLVASGNRAGGQEIFPARKRKQRRKTTRWPPLSCIYRPWIGLFLFGLRKPLSSQMEKSGFFIFSFSFSFFLVILFYFIFFLLFFFFSFLSLSLFSLFSLFSFLFFFLFLFLFLIFKFKRFPLVTAATTAVAFCEALFWFYSSDSSNGAGLPFFFFSFLFFFFH